MLNTTDEMLHAAARLIAQQQVMPPDKKQLRFNEIVSAAKLFYPNDIITGVRELTIACFPMLLPDEPNPLYVKGQPMHAVLQEQYRWMLNQER